MTIGQRIRISREQSGKTLEELSSIVGVSRQTLSRYETGVISNIPSDNLEKIAFALNITPSFLMGWEDETAKEKPDAESDELERLLQNPLNKEFYEKFQRLTEEQKEMMIAQMRVLLKDHSDKQ